MVPLTELLAQDLDGNFPQLVTEMAPRLYTGLCRMFGQDAEDLCQETYVRAYQALSKYDPERIRALNLAGWLWTIALNLGRSQFRRAHLYPQLQLNDSHLATTLTEHPPTIWSEWDRRLDRLSFPQRQAVVLRHIGQFDYTEIAEICARPQATVRTDVSRGLKKLREIMENENDH